MIAPMDCGYTSASHSFKGEIRRLRKAGYYVTNAAKGKIAEMFKTEAFDSEISRFNCNMRINQKNGFLTEYPPELRLIEFKELYARLRQIRSGFRKFYHNYTNFLVIYIQKKSAVMQDRDLLLARKRMWHPDDAVLSMTVVILEKKKLLRTF